MSLRARLILAFTVLVLMVIALVGAVAIRSTRGVLIDQIEDRIRTASREDIFPALGRGGGGARTLAVVILNADGEITRSLPSGFPGQFDPLPDTNGLEVVQLGPGRMVTIPALEGTSTYRALAIRDQEGNTYVIAHTLRDVVAAQAAVTRRLLLGGGAVWLLGIGAIWLTVSRGLRPVDDMIDAAAAIAGGDYSQRVPTADPGSELGRLGTSLNEMLSSIEEAFASESRANARLKQFVADASHELRTPLAAISGYAELMRKGELTASPDQDKAAGRIEAETRRMSRLVDDLMLLARLDLAGGDEGASPLDLHRVDLTAVVRDAVADHHAIDESRPVTVESPGPMWVEGDEQRLTQVVTNLLANLRLHTPEGSATTIKLDRGPGVVRLEYADNGPGFSPEALPRAFDRFYRADVSRSRKSGGSGLGLAIVAAIIEGHGGEVAAKTAAGGGAQVTVVLPALPDSR
ncbi:MAG TPA: ATP-binding protein [Acidimicrobiia bacterium]|nr:ATP-binding protein [Acidimicrobiia bacterium]